MSESCSVVFVTPWTTQSVEFSRPEYWSGWPFPSPGDLPSQGMELKFNSRYTDKMLCGREDEVVFLKGLRDGKRGKGAKSEDLGQNCV